MFIHNPKVAGTSLATALIKATLSKYQQFNYEIDLGVKKILNRFNLLGKVDISNPFYRDPSDEILKKYKTIHVTPQQVKSVLDEELYSKIFKFVFVRNPWDLHVSLYKYFSLKSYSKKGHKISKMSFEEYLEWRIQKGIGLQKRFVVDQDDTQIVDFIGRFENLSNDYSTLCQKIGIKSEELPFLNQSNKKPYQEFYTEETRKIIADYLKEDIEYFGYSF